MDSFIPEEESAHREDSHTSAYLTIDVDSRAFHGETTDGEPAPPSNVNGKFFHGAQNHMYAVELLTDDRHQVGSYMAWVHPTRPGSYYLAYLNSDRDVNDFAISRGTDGLFNCEGTKGKTMAEIVARLREKGTPLKHPLPADKDYDHML